MRQSLPHLVVVGSGITERFTSPTDVERLTDSSAFGHRAFRQTTLDGRVHWASTETASVAAGHIEGALAGAEREVQHVTAGLASESERHDPSGTRS